MCLPVLRFELKVGVRITIFATIFVLCTIYGICYCFHFDSILCNFRELSFFVPLLTSFLLSVNTVLIITSWNSPVKYIYKNDRKLCHKMTEIDVTLKQTIKNGSQVRGFRKFLKLLGSDPTLWFLLFGSILQICSTVSTSFIEEEHMIWYFLWTTLLTLMLHRCPQKEGLIVFVMLITHRIICKLNQTGDKWASLPDIKDWFKVPNRIGYLSMFTILGNRYLFKLLKK